MIGALIGDEIGGAMSLPSIGSGVGLPHAVTSNDVIFQPVDCVLAGQQENSRPGSARGRVLRHIFKE